jgi:hypothetical protein
MTKTKLNRAVNCCMGNDVKFNTHSGHLFLSIPFYLFLTVVSKTLADYRRYIHIRSKLLLADMSAVSENA